MIKFANLLKLGFAVTVTVMPALANSTTFAGYTQIDNTQDFALTSTSLGGGDYSVTIMDVGQVSFSYYIGGTPFGAASQLATLNLTATATFSGNCSSSSGLHYQRQHLYRDRLLRDFFGYGQHSFCRND